MGEVSGSMRWKSICFSSHMMQNLFTCTLLHSVERRMSCIKCSYTSLQWFLTAMYKADVEISLSYLCLFGSAGLQSKLNTDQLILGTQYFHKGVPSIVTTLSLSWKYISRYGFPLWMRTQNIMILSEKPSQLQSFFWFWVIFNTFRLNHRMCTGICLTLLIVGLSLFLVPECTFICFFFLIQTFHSIKAWRSSGIKLQLNILWFLEFIT